MDDMGTPYASLHEINPDLVMASSQLMGSSGPWKDWIGYGPSTRPAGGMTYLWNFDDGGMPPGSGAIHPDHLVGRMLAVGALATLARRRGWRRPRRGGPGRDADQRARRPVPGRRPRPWVGPSTGQPVGPGAPWGVYQCVGEERWCVITVRDDDDWQRLRKALGDPEWAQASELDSADGRRRRHDELDAHLAEWTATRTDVEVMETLQAVGVPAGLMAYPSDLAENEHSRRPPLPATGRAAADRRAAARGRGVRGHRDPRTARDPRPRSSVSTPARSAGRSWP